MTQKALDLEKTENIALRPAAKATRPIWTLADDVGRVEKLPVLAVTDRKGQCPRCGVGFSGLGNFDTHQKFLSDGTLICLEPSRAGLIERDGWWGGEAWDAASVFGR